MSSVYVLCSNGELLMEPVFPGDADGLTAARAEMNSRVSADETAATSKYTSRDTVSNTVSVQDHPEFPDDAKAVIVRRTISSTRNGFILENSNDIYYSCYRVVLLSSE